MRRFFHRKQQQARPGGTAAASTTNGGTTSRLPTTLSPKHTTTGRVRAPALRSRSMTVLYGSETDGSAVVSPGGGRAKRFGISRSMSFNEEAANLQGNTKFLTKSEEDEVFKMYTRKLYLMFALLSAIITGFVVYAYMYNTGGKKA